MRGLLQRVRGTGHQRLVTWPVLAVLCVVVLYPVWILVQKSLRISDYNRTFTLRWYDQLISPNGLRAILTTAILVLTAGLISVVLGLVLAWMVERVDIRLVFLARLVPIFPILVPGVMGAAAWAFLLSPNAGYINVAIRGMVGSTSDSGPLNVYSLAGIIFVVTLYVVPYTYTVFYPAFRAMDATMEESAQIAGAGPFTVVRTVTLGLLRPAMLGAILLSFVLVIEHFVIPFVLGYGRVTVLTTRIYSAMAITFPAQVGAATATSMLAVVPALVFVALQYRLLRRGDYAVIGGKGGGARRIRHPVARWIAGSTLVVYALLAFVLPILGITLVALQPFWDGHVKLSALSLKGFTSLNSIYPEWLTAVRTSGILAVVGSTVSVLFAFIIAYLSIREKTRAGRALDLISTIPSGIPATVLGVGFLVAFIRPPFALYGTVWLLLLAYFVIFLPFATRPVAAAIRQVSPQLEDASRISGASWFSTVRRITFPLVLTSILAAWALLFLMLSREVAASVFLAAAGQHLVGPAIFELWTDGKVQALAVFSLIVIAGSLVLVAISQWLGGRQSASLGFGRSVRRGARREMKAFAKDHGSTTPSLRVRVSGPEEAPREPTSGAATNISSAHHR